MSSNDTDAVLLIQALLDHCDELRQEVISLRKAAGYMDVHSDLVYDISRFPAYTAYKDYLSLHYE